MSYVSVHFSGLGLIAKMINSLFLWSRNGNILRQSLNCKRLAFSIEGFETCSFIHTSSQHKMARRWQKEIAFQSELTNPVAVVYGGEKKAPDDVGVPFDKKPFKVNVKKYHLYTWCGCGRSHNQPFCDGTHKNMYLKRIIKGGPVKYIAPEDREIWFCNCKQVCIGRFNSLVTMQLIL